MNNGRRIAKIGFQWILPIMVLAAIVWQFASILRRAEVQEQIGKLNFRWQWMLASGLLYLFAHCIWANFWVRLLHQQGLPTSHGVGTRAYFISQLGKYVPGKIWVIAIRVGMIGNDTKTRVIVGVTATFEALTSMATGAFVGALLLPLLSIDLSKFGAKNYSLLAVGAVPIGLVLLNRLIVTIAKKQGRTGAGDIPLMRFGTLLGGILQTAVGWLLMGVSFWMAMQGILPNPTTPDIYELLRLTAINAISYVIGFVFLFMPAGAGIREEVMKQLLAPEFAPEFGDGALGVALYISLILRLVWTTAEILLVGFLVLQKKTPILPKNNPALLPETAL